MTIQDELNKYGNLITGVTIDRGDGDEYFDVIGAERNALNNVWLRLENEDYIDAQWLESCDKVKFHLKNEVIIKEDVKYIITLKESELKGIVNTLMDTYDRLIETLSKSDSIVENYNELPDKIWGIKRKLQNIVKGKDEA